MFLVMGITGKVGGATAEHLLAHGKEVRALVRNREKASSWANQGVELVDGDWNNSAAIEQVLKGVEGAFVMLRAVWPPLPDYKEAKGVIANYVEALTKAAPMSAMRDSSPRPDSRESAQPSFRTVCKIFETAILCQKSGGFERTAYPAFVGAATSANTLVTS